MVERMLRTGKGSPRRMHINQGDNGLLFGFLRSNYIVEVTDLVHCEDWNGSSACRHALEEMDKLEMVVLVLRDLEAASKSPPRNV